MIREIETLLIKKKLVDRTEKIRFLKMPSKKNKNSFIPLLIFLGNNEIPSFIAKIFKNPNNASLFHYLINKHLKIKKNLEGSDLIHALPETFVYYPHCKFFVESYCRGKNLVPIFANAVKAKSDTFNLVLSNVMKWLYEFHKHTFKGIISATDLYFCFTDAELEMLEDIFGSKYPVILNFLNKISLYNCTIPITCCHGDFNAYNIKIDSGVIKVYDWEDSSERDVPLLDLFHLFTVPVISNSFISGGYKKTFANYICSSSPFKLIFSKELRNYSERFDIDKEFANWYYLAYLLKMCLKERNAFRYDDSREKVWADIAIMYVEESDAKLLI